MGLIHSVIKQAIAQSKIVAVLFVIQQLVKLVMINVFLDAKQYLVVKIVK